MGVTAPVLSDGQARYTPGVSERRGGVTTYLHSGLKNAGAQSGASQTLTGSRHYDAWGRVWPGSSSGTWQGPFGYAGAFGYQTEPDSGLKLLGHRYYDPETGRFLSRDPIQDGPNWYAYGGGSGSPLSFADPTGLLIDFFFDAVSVTVSVVEFVRNPSLATGGALVADVAGAIVPGVPSIGGHIIRGGRRAVGGEARPRFEDDTPAKTMVGRPVRPGLNAPTVIHGRPYSGHALDSMQERGLVPTVVEDVIRNGVTKPGKRPGTVDHFLGSRKVTTDASTGTVVTAW